MPHKPPAEYIGHPGSLDAPLATGDLVDLCSSPWALDAYSPLGEHNYLLLKVTPREWEDDTPQFESVVRCLRGLPCPVIAVLTSTQASLPASLLRSVDVVLNSLSEAASLVRNIDAQPLAAMTLVQLLRHNEECSPEQGLVAESLAYASLQGRRTMTQRVQPGAGNVDDTGVGEPVLISRNNDELHIRLNRPSERNAYSARMRDALYDALQLLKSDASLHRGVISGEGSCFSVGGDLAEFGLVPDSSTAHAIRSSRNVGRLLLQLGPRLEFRLHRACIGAGIELPAFAGRVLAESNTFMQLPEIRMGLLPGAGGTVSLVQRIGRHRTTYLALSARRINAATALEWGLIDGFL